MDSDLQTSQDVGNTGGVLSAIKRATRSPVLWMLLIALLPHARFPSLSLYGDGERNVYQAEALKNGKGFVRWARFNMLPPGFVDRPETGLPPGYPIWLATVMGLSDISSVPFLGLLHVLQVTMSVASCFLIYDAIRPKSWLLATFAFLTMAACPMLHTLTATAFSEVLSVFLMACLAWQLSRLELFGPSWSRCFAIGSLTVGALFTAPAVAPLTFLIWCYAAWQIRTRLPLIASLTAGSLLLMVPWQWHCYRATGHLQPTVYELPIIPDSEFTRWFRTWASCEHDLCVLFDPVNIDSIPPKTAFASSQERKELTSLYKESFAEQKQQHVIRDYDPVWLSKGYDSRKGTLLTPEAEQIFGEVADRQIAAHPWQYYVVLPLRRALSIWAFRMPVSNPVELLEGLVGNVVNLIMIATILASVVLTFRSGSILPLLVAFSVIFYVLASAYTAHAEERRNLPFYPMILYTWFYAVRPNSVVAPKTQSA